MTEPGRSGRRDGSPPQSPRSPRAGSGRDAPSPSGAEFAGAGLQLALTIVVFMFLGIWLDKTLHSSPWFVLLCVFLGAGAGFYSLYRRLMRGTRTGGGAGPADGSRR